LWVSMDLDGLKSGSLNAQLNLVANGRQTSQ
jgi:hypothetical protein